MNMKIKITRNYSEFVSDLMNRPLDETRQAKLRHLRESMQTQGFQPFPLIVRREGDKLHVLDGQCRLHVAEELKLPVMYVETDRPFDIRKCGIAVAAWKFSDFVNTYVKQGNQDYQTLIDFSRETGLPLFRAAGLLGGYVNSDSRRSEKVAEGKFKVKDLDFAYRVSGLANAVAQHPAAAVWAKTTNSIAALSRFVTVAEFDDEQMKAKAAAHPHMLQRCGTLDQYSRMYEALYNFASRQKLNIHFLADQVAAARKLEGFSAEKRKVA